MEAFAFKPGKYNAKKLCLEPTSFTVKAEGVNPTGAHWLLEAEEMRRSSLRRR
jgi:hypothetical protein